MRVAFWNIHKMTRCVPAPAFVAQTLLSAEADVICLTEYVTDPALVQALAAGYHVAESRTVTGNQVLLAVRRTFAPDGIRIVAADELPDSCNLLHITFDREDGRPLDVLGIRMLSPMRGEVRVPPLRRALDALDGSFLCMGDFNIHAYRMSHWFPKIRRGRMADPRAFSYVFTGKETHRITGTGTIDHLLLSDDMDAVVSCDWGYTALDPRYPGTPPLPVGTDWRIPVGLPDHALMTAEITDVT